MEILKNSQVSRAIFLLTIMVCSCSLTDGKIIYVGNDGQADFNNIQAGIDVAVDGDTVLVAPGTYTGEGNRDIDFKGKAITVKSEEGPETCIIDCQGSEDDFHRGFYFHTNEDVNSVLQGFTITNGYNTYNIVRAFMGGAIFCDASSPLISNCIVTENIALDGGGIGCNSSNAVIANCIITGNRSGMGRGGGIFCINSSLHILDCLIADNIAFERGGGIKCDYSNPTITGCIIQSNAADDGGGVGIGTMGSMSSLLTMTNCFITGNKADGLGGGIFISGKITLLNCTIFGNHAGSDGGGINFVATEGRINNSIMYGNITPRATGNEISRPLPGAGGCNPDSIKITNSIVGSDPNGITFPFCFSGEWLYADPLFANPGYWDSNGTPDNPNDDFWVEGDYHLKSQAGRWDSNSKSWIQDEVTSPCIDTGDPNSPIGHEPFPNGGIINMGAYGGTAQASKSLSGKSIYIFMPGQSMLIQTGGIAGVNWTYILSGQFQLTIDFGAGKARFSKVEAIATGHSEPVRTLDPNDVFNLTGLTGTISKAGYIEFTGRTADGSDVLLYLTLSDEWISLKGQTTPPPNSADFFIFDLDAVAQRKYGGGTGESNYPHLIYTAEHLNAIGAESNDWNKHFKLMADIDLSGYSYDRAVIAPDADPCDLDFQGISFTGVLDGNGHKISNLTITGTHYLGLFGRLESGAEIKNLGVIDVNIAGSEYVGGFVGFSKGNISTCYCTGTVTGNKRIGGITGRNWRNITESYSTATITGKNSAGGIAAENYGSITNCYSTGTVTGNWDVGGLVGVNYSSIATSYSTGTVIGTNRAGGLVGYNYQDSIVTSNFWNVDTSGQSTSDGGTGKTTAEMQTTSTFLEAGWDFVDETENGTEDIWWILEGRDYPRLAWELTE